MPEVAHVPPPPIDPAAAKSTSGYLILLLLWVLGLLIAVEWHLINSSAGKEALQRIRSDARVTREFGNDVRIPFVIGWWSPSAFRWWSGGDAFLYAYVTGSGGHGHATVELGDAGNHWVISSLEVYNTSEAHLIKLSGPEIPAKPEQLHAAGTLYFVPLGDAATSKVNDLAAFFGQQFDIVAKVLPAVDMPDEAYDQGRKQWVADILTQFMALRFPEIATDPDAKLIGVLEDDLYIRSFNWNFTYSYRVSNKYSVIPTVRLDPGFQHLPPNPAIKMERLQKVAMKAVALLHLGWEESSNPRSVDAIEATLENIDRMASVYLASDVRAPGPYADFDGTPCLTVYSRNLSGPPLRNPIIPCGRTEDFAGTQFSIDLARGKFQSVRTDLYRTGPLPLALLRMNYGYRFDDQVRAFGKDSWQSLDDTVWSADPISIQNINIYGTQFDRITPGKGFSPQAKYLAGNSGGIFRNALLSWDSTGGWRVDTIDGEVWRYLGCSPRIRIQCYYIGRTTLAGDAIEVKRDPGTGHILQVSQKTNPNFPAASAYDHTWTPTYEGDKITRIEDSDGRSAHYFYDSTEYLTDIEADGHHFHYDYDDRHRPIGVVEDGRTLRIRYDSEGRPDKLNLSDGSSYVVRYSGDAVEVAAPDADYSVQVLPTYFRLVEHAGTKH